MPTNSHHELANTYFVQDRSNLSDQWGQTAKLVPLLQHHGFSQVQTQEHTITYHGGTPEGQLFYENMAKLYHTIVPFLRQWLHLPQDYREIYQQAMHDLQQPDSINTWFLLTAWSIVPSKQASSRLENA